MTELLDAEFADLQAREKKLEAKRMALRFLSRREYGAWELQQKLRGKGFAPELIDALLEELQTGGLQSDARFAESYARYRQAKGFGPLRIAQELKQKHIAQASVDLALNNCEVPWDEQIRQVRAKRFGAALPTDIKNKAKQVRFLQYRGFSQEQINWLMSEEA